MSLPDLPRDCACCVHYFECPGPCGDDKPHWQLRTGVER